LEHAVSLAGEIQTLGRRAIAVDEGGMAAWAPKAGLIINSTTKGQGGVRKLSGGMATLLALYSALAPAHPAAVPESDATHADFESRWLAAAKADIEANNEASSRLAASLPHETRFYDLIYHPEETVFLRHGRLTGHQTMNGKSMIVCQAVIAFCKRICQRQLSQLGKNNAATFRTVAEVMHRTW
jgi:hypothetical protein